MEKYSAQRETLYKLLINNKNHPTADELYLNLKEQISNISLGTVYRNLAKLSESGKILKLTFKNSPDRYDGDINPHMHFICSRCNSVFDFYIDPINKAYNSFLQSVSDFNQDFDVTETNINFSGLCPSCKIKNNLTIS